MQRVVWDPVDRMYLLLERRFDPTFLRMIQFTVDKAKSIDQLKKQAALRDKKKKPKNWFSEGVLKAWIL